MWWLYQRSLWIICIRYLTRPFYRSNHAPSIKIDWKTELIKNKNWHFQLTVSANEDNFKFQAVFQIRTVLRSAYRLTLRKIQEKLVSLSARRIISFIGGIVEDALVLVLSPLLAWVCTINSIVCITVIMCELS